MRLVEPTEDAWSQPKIGVERNGVTFHDIYTHNSTNHTYSGEIVIDGETYGFVVESGDNNGTVVHGWGDPDTVTPFEHPEPPEPYTFLPRNPEYMQVHRPAMWKVYLVWREEPWFKEKERGLNYDRYFAPGVKTNTHYRDWADAKGMQIGLWSDVCILSDDEIEAEKAKAANCMTKEEFVAMMTAPD
jgi:hypothetical protein